MNPWLRIPLADYEGHMNLPEVGQAELLARIMADSVARWHARSVAVLGCAGGNGFERLEEAGVVRVVGVDINPAYIDVAEERFRGRVPGLELYAGDIEEGALAFEPVDLLFAGLIFEYVEPERAITAMRRMIRPEGVLVAVLQLPCSDIPEVTPSPFATLESLSSIMRLVEPDRLARIAESHGFARSSGTVVRTPGGKDFHIAVFRRKGLVAPAAD